jgi:hypothetical protein
MYYIMLYTDVNPRCFKIIIVLIVSSFDVALTNVVTGISKFRAT